ncbi:MAG: hypothetical protein AABX14_01220 [Candidatus Aenigmatarchaeota archaeon]
MPNSALERARSPVTRVREMIRSPATYIGTAVMPSVLYSLGAPMRSLEDIAGYVGFGLAGTILGYVIDEYGTRVVLGNVSPRVTARRLRQSYECQHRTNRQNDAVILVADDDLDHHANCAMYNHFRKRKSFLGYTIDETHSIEHANVSDLRDAIMNENVGSIVLFGHATWGSWCASDRSVSWKEVSKWTKEGNHCKSGFGIKMGCNPIRDSEHDDYQLLAPAFGHKEHHGGLYIMEGIPDNPIEPESMITSGPSVSTRPGFIQLVS